MIVIDMPRIASRPRRVAIIGSCRVREPATILIRRREAMFVWEMPVLTHTVTEAAQCLSYATGACEIPTAYQAFAFFNDLQSFAGGLTQELLQSIDTFVVEICDLKQIRLGQIYFQQNYFREIFLTPNASALLPWFREFSRGNTPPASVIETTIGQLAKAGVSVTDEIEAILRSCCFEELGSGELLSAVDTLMFDKSKEWIFVSHFIVPEEKGSIMLDRHRLIEALRSVTQETGASLFDPSIFFTEHDRKEILDDNGVNFYEYSPAFREIVATRLAKEISRGNALTRPVDPSFVNAVASRVNAMLIACHDERCASLGVEDSGLHQHYKSMLDLRRFLPDWQIDIAVLIVNFLPKFEQYFLTNAGLGELAFVLAACGLTTISLQQYTKRYGALEAGLARFRSNDPEAAKRCGIVHGFLPQIVTSGQRSLAVVIDATTPPESEGEMSNVRKFAMFDALLVNPRLFLRVREGKDEQEYALSLIQEAGFRLVRRYPTIQLVYFEKSESVA